MTFGKRLSDLREERFVSKTELAEAVGTSRQMITKYETDEIQPGIIVLVKIADFFKVSADYLLCRDDYVTIPKDKKYFYVRLPEELTEDDRFMLKEMSIALQRKNMKKI